MTPTDTRPQSWNNFEFLPDYCGRCNPLGHHANGQARLASLTEPDAVTWHPGRRWVVCEYVCDSCGHQWLRGDLWTAYEAGFEVA